MYLTIQKRLIFTVLLLSSFNLFSQQTTINGKVTDAETGEGMPFVNVFFKGTTIGVTTNFEGYYKIVSDQPKDSLTASYIGFKAKSKVVKKGFNQTINFQLSAEATTLETIEIVYGDYENPAWEILRGVVENKKKNDKRKLEAYQYESYTKIEIDVDNMTEKFRKKKIVKKITTVLDSIDQIAGEDGKPILPVFISESLSDFYYLKSQNRKRENIKKTKVTGIGITDGSTISQIIGSSFQEYNFYKNWMKIVNKDFVSPISENWKAFYEYELKPEFEFIDGIKCNRIEFKPKRPQDLAFIGSMWITDESFALKQIDVRIDKASNLNFIEKVKIQQSLTQTKEGAWLPNKTRVLVDVGEVRDDWAGMLAKFYVSNNHIVVNQPKPHSFFDEDVVVDERALVDNGEDFWIDHRHDTLSATEKHVYLMIDTLRNLPVVKTYVEIIDIAINGYKPIGKFDFGPYTYLYANNNIEGHRFRLGINTNEKFSDKWILNTFLAYGTKDEEFKYKVGGSYILSRKPWTLVGASREVDIERVGIFNDNYVNTPLFNAFTKFGDLRRPFRNTMNKFWFQTNLSPSLRQRIIYRNREFEPLGDYDFKYKSENGDVKTNFTISELSFELRLAIGEKFLQNDNKRVSLGTSGRPIFTLRYTKGFKDFWGGDFSYNKFEFEMKQTFRLFSLGKTRYRIRAGYIPSNLPYPLLETHLGNESTFYNGNSFNMMNYFEFASDTYVALKAIHRFEGLILNRIPLMKKLKWRLFVTSDVLYGSVRDENIEITQFQTDEVAAFSPLEKDRPYVEVGYGIENILRFIRVDFQHRLNYLENAQSGSFGVKVSAQFRL